MILISLKVPAWENSRLLEEFMVCSSQHLKGKQDSIICSSQHTLPMDQLSFAIFYNFSLPQLYRAPLSPTPWILISLKMPHCLCINPSEAQFPGPIPYYNTTSLLYSSTAQETTGTLTQWKTLNYHSFRKSFFPKGMQIGVRVTDECQVHV